MQVAEPLDHLFMRIQKESSSGGVLMFLQRGVLEDLVQCS
jgi:hypothetical protein